MIYGPLPIHFVERLKERLAEQGSTCKVYSSEEATEKYKNEVRSRPLSQYPTFDSAPDLLYVEIELKDLLIVKKELQQMGVTLNDSEFDPQFERQEYLCPKCEAVFSAPGQCPKHKLALLEFSEFARGKSGRVQSREGLLVKAFLVGVVAFILWKIISGQ